MLHPSYSDLMAVVNSEVEQGEQPVVQSRYSIVLATAKRARQIIGGQQPLVPAKGKGLKPLSVAVTELHDSKIKILTEEDFLAEQAAEDIKAEEAKVILAANAAKEAERAAAKAAEEAAKAAEEAEADDEEEEEDAEDVEMADEADDEEEEE